MSNLKKFLAIFVLAISVTHVLAAQSLQSTTPASPPATVAKPSVASPPVVPKDYVIGPDDVLSVVFWTAKELSAEALVRPDGKISLPILNDVVAAGMTPEQLAVTIGQAAKKFVQDPGVTVIVKAINSRKVYVVGEVAKPGSMPLGTGMNVLQAIGEAGGFLEGAKKDDVVVVRVENGQEHRYKVKYNDIMRGKNLQQNLRLQAGDTIIVR